MPRKFSCAPIKSENVPLLRKVVNSVFGGESPFKAEVWFVNHKPKMDMKWGTMSPILLEDPTYGIIVPVRSYGQYGIKVKNPRLFIEQLVGNSKMFTIKELTSFFNGKILSYVTSLISQHISINKISVLDINSYLCELSDYCKQNIIQHFDMYGLDLLSFDFMSVNLPDNDPSMTKLREAKATAAQLNIEGRDFYQMRRSFDVLEKAAGNPGTGGQMLAMGTGLGMGVRVGGAIGETFNRVINTSPQVTPPPLPDSVLYYVYLNGEKIPNLSFDQVVQMVRQGVIKNDTLVWTAGMKKWQKVCAMSEFNSLFMTNN